MNQELVKQISMGVSESIEKIFNTNDIKDLSIKIGILNQKIDDLPCKKHESILEEHNKKVENLRLINSASKGGYNFLFKLFAILNSLAILILMTLAFLK